MMNSISLHDFGISWDKNSTVKIYSNHFSSSSKWDDSGESLNLDHSPFGIPIIKLNSVFNLVSSLLSIIPYLQVSSFPKLLTVYSSTSPY